MTTHTIQTNPDRFESVVTGAWYFYAPVDPNYRIGDTLHFEEIDPETQSPTGRTFEKVIRDIEGPRAGIRPGFVALFFVPMMKSNFAKFANPT